MLEDLPKDKLKGFLEVTLAVSSKPTETVRPTATPAPVTPSLVAEASSYEIPPIENILGAPDLTEVAEKTLTPKAWAFYSSAATDLITHSNNKQLTRRIMFRPRVLKKCERSEYGPKYSWVQHEKPHSSRVRRQWRVWLTRTVNLLLAEVFRMKASFNV